MITTIIGHFRVHLSLYFKARFSAKSFLWILVFLHVESRTNYHNKHFALTRFEKETEGNSEMVYWIEESTCERDNTVETFLASLSVSPNLTFTIFGKACCLPSTSLLVALHDNVRNTWPPAGRSVICVAFCLRWLSAFPVPGQYHGVIFVSFEKTLCRLRWGDESGFPFFKVANRKERSWSVYI